MLDHAVVLMDHTAGTPSTSPINILQESSLSLIPATKLLRFNSSTLITTIDTPLNVTLTATWSPEGDRITYHISNPDSGTLSNVSALNGTFTFIPAGGYSGTVNIPVRVGDSWQTSENTIRIQVGSSNGIIPTMDPIDDIVVQEDSSTLAIPLNGISAGTSLQDIPINIRTSSSSIANIEILYTSPASSGTLLITPLTNTFGVDNGTLYRRQWHRAT